MERCVSSPKQSGPDKVNVLQPEELFFVIANMTSVFMVLKFSNTAVMHCPIAVFLHFL